MRECHLCFKKAVPSDAEIIVVARNRSFYQDFIHFGECPGYHTDVLKMEQIIRNGTVIKLLDSDTVIGDISIRIKDPAYYWVGCFEIVPEYQNRGLGQAAWKHVEARFSFVRKWGLDTPVQDVLNCHFYEKLGFMGVKDTVYSDKLTLRLYEKTTAVGRNLPLTVRCQEEETDKRKNAALEGESNDSYQGWACN